VTHQDYLELRLQLLMRFAPGWWIRENSTRFVPLDPYTPIEHWYTQEGTGFDYFSSGAVCLPVAFVNVILNEKYQSLTDDEKVIFKLTMNNR